MSTTDRKLPFLDEALSDERMLAFFNDRVLPSLYPGRTVKKLKTQRAFYTPGERCLMLYTLKADGRDRLPPFALLSFTANGSLEQEYRKHYIDGIVPGDAAATFLDDVGVLVEFFPMDLKLPGLRLATDMERMRPLLDAAASRLRGSSGVGGDWRCAVPRYHPRVRCVFDYTDAGSAGRGSRLIGKTYARDRKAAKVWSVLCALHEFAPADGAWRIPEPLTFVDEANFMLMEHVPGIAMTHILCADGAEPARCAELVETAGRIVAEIHKMPMSGLPLRPVEKGRSKTYWRTGRIERFVPELAREITAVLDEISARASGSEPARETFIHGSPSPKQFLVDGDRMSLLDLDGAHVGDPALDVGVFLATMCKYRQKAAVPSVLDGLDERFLEAYQQVSGDPRIGRRARLIQAQDLVGYAVRRIAREPFAYGTTKKPKKALRLLEEARSCLATL